MLKEEGFEVSPRKILKGTDIVSVRCVTNLKVITTKNYDNYKNTTSKYRGEYDFKKL